MTDGFVDVHCHILPGLDDGSGSMEMTMEMIDMAYAEGIRQIVFTPHIRRPWLDRPAQKDEETFAAVEEKVKERYPEMKLYLGCEFAYTDVMLEERIEKCRPMGNTDVALLEFKPGDSVNKIIDGVQKVQMEGFDILIAHIERYDAMLEDIRDTDRLLDMGVMIQINADDITDPESRKVKKYLKEMIRTHRVHVVGTDAHETKRRKPEMQKAYKIAAKWGGEDYARDIFSRNAQRILAGEILN